MKKIILATGTAALIAASGFAYAQTAAGNGAAPRERPRPERMSKEDVSSLVDARIAAVQAGLKLTPDQQKLFQPVEEQVRKTASARAERWTQMREERRSDRQAGTPPDFAARLDRMADMAQQRAEDAKAFASVVKPFYASLDDRQKRLLPRLIRPIGGMGPERGWHRGPGGQR